MKNWKIIDQISNKLESNFYKGYTIDKDTLNKVSELIGESLSIRGYKGTEKKLQKILFHEDLLYDIGLYDIEVIHKSFTKSFKFYWIPFSKQRSLFKKSIKVYK